jgi:hypothetical protein
VRLTGFPSTGAPNSYHGAGPTSNIDYTSHQDLSLAFIQSAVVQNMQIQQQLMTQNMQIQQQLMTQNQALQQLLNTVHQCCKFWFVLQICLFVFYIFMVLTVV